MNSFIVLKYQLLCNTVQFLEAGKKIKLNYESTFAKLIARHRSDCTDRTYFKLVFH